MKNGEKASDCGCNCSSRYFNGDRNNPDNGNNRKSSLTSGELCEILQSLIATIMVVACFLAENCSSSTLSRIHSSKDGESLNFLVIGDWGRKGLYNQSHVATQMGRIGEELNIDFVISTGDNFYPSGLTGTNDPAFSESLSQIYTAKSLQKTWHSVLGNHDYRGNALAQLSGAIKLRDPRWNCKRSFILEQTICSQIDCHVVEFFFIDTTPMVNKYWHDTHSYDWRGVMPRKNYIAQQLQDLKDALESSTATWKIVVGHHGIRSVGSHGDTEELQVQLSPLLKSHGVDLYLNGHDHCLEHIATLDGELHFVTSGAGSKAWRGMKSKANTEGLKFFHDGQGFVSVEIRSMTLHIVYYNVDGKNMHQFNVTKKTHDIL